MRKYHLSFVLVLPIIVLFAANVFFAIGTSSKAAVLMQLEKRSSAIESENRLLGEKIINSNSLTKISESIEQLGLVTPQQVVYLAQEDQLAWKKD